MPRFSLFLLGPPRLELDGAPLEFGNRKVVALLAYLAVMRQVHSRDTLATLFWPESDQGRARAALRSALWALNKALGPGHLEIETETIALAETANLAVDVELFLGNLAACQGHGHGEAEVCPACLAPLAEAIKLYRNDFLAGFSLRDSPEFDDWQFFQSEYLRRELGNALARLVQGQAAQGQFEAATTSAWRWLELDNLHEPAHQQLMLLHAWNGHPTAALRQYQECMQLLDQELGVSPSPETTQLYEALKANRTPAPPTPVLSPLPSPSTALAPSVPSTPALPPPPVEQRKQLTVLSLDLSAFTALAEAIDPEEANEWMDRLWPRWQPI